MSALSWLVAMTCLRVPYAPFSANGKSVAKVGGAVVGGMLGGPIGAVVGAQAMKPPGHG